MRLTIAIVAGLLVCLILGSATPAQQTPKGTPLTGAELHALLDGGALLDSVQMDSEVRTTRLVAKGGVMHIVWWHPSGLAGYDTGHWRIDGDAFCRRWSKLEGGVEVCSRQYRVDDNRYEARSVRDGELFTVYSVRN